jgi:hypothetical protein
MTKNHMFDSVLAFVMGTGIGLLLSVFGQKVLNKHYVNTCHTKPNHNLIYTQGFLGDTYYCIHDAHMGVGK